MCEDYNSPQSAYWSLKSFIVVLLADDDEFWASSELPYPNLDRTSGDGGVAVVEPPTQILCNHAQGSHHFLLSVGQFVGWQMKATQAKYCKFAYSSAFGFSVATGPSLTQLAPDSSLVLSRDFAETWAGKWRCRGARFASTSICTSRGLEKFETTPIATVEWHPWQDSTVRVITTLVPPTNRWPDWHVRIHRVEVREPGQLKHLLTVEGGFAISRETDRCLGDLPTFRAEEISTNDTILGETEGIYSTDSGVLVLSIAGASGIHAGNPYNRGISMATEARPLIPEPNTNLTAQRTIIPVIQREILNIDLPCQVTFVTSVFALATASSTDRYHLGEDSFWKKWADVPRVRIGEGRNEDELGDFIQIPINL